MTKQNVDHPIQQNHPFNKHEKLVSLVRKFVKSGFRGKRFGGIAC